MEHSHLKAKKFESDKYRPCGGCRCGRPHSPPGYLVLKFDDPDAQPAIAEYVIAILHQDEVLAVDILRALHHAEKRA